MSYRIPPKVSQYPDQAASADAQPRFLVVLQATAGTDTVHIRALRYLLKKLLRSHGLHCTEVRQLGPDANGGEQ
jgi:hypothetical protein